MMNILVIVRTVSILLTSPSIKIVANHFKIRKKQLVVSARLIRWNGHFTLG